MLMNANLDSYTPEVIDSNYYEQGILLGISFNPYAYKIVSPIILSSGTSAKIGMKTQLNLHTRPKYLIFPRTCTHDTELKILRGEVANFLVHLNKGIRTKKD